jgi:methylmalonyl-CoA decarboxylase subunit alpha
LSSLRGMIKMNKIEELLIKNKTITGDANFEKQHKLGKLTARERINYLLDDNSFMEINKFVKHRCTRFGMDKKEVRSDGVVTGCGTIDGRLVYIFAQDFTAMGGTLGEMHAKKICRIMDMAYDNGAPVIGLNDSGGARIQEGIDALSGYGQIFYRNVKYSGIIPQISAIMGPCAGGAVYSPALSDFILMTDKTGSMFITGPDVIKTVTGEDITEEDLGGAKVHGNKSGVVHFVCYDDRNCLDIIKKLLSYIPSNNLSFAPFLSNEDDINRVCLELNTIIPGLENKAYDMKKIIEQVSDYNEFFEIQKNYAENIITGFSRFGGHAAGIVANQPCHMAGCIDINASDKAARFIRFCDSFNIPVINFVDVPGFLPGCNQEFGGIIRHGAKLLYAYSEASVPKITIIVRKAMGGAYIAMCSKEMGADAVFAWPDAEIAVMGASGAARIIFKKDSDLTGQQQIEKYNQEFLNPYKGAERGYIDDVIEPSKTRKYINAFLLMLNSKRPKKPLKKHGNIPL